MKHNKANTAAKILMIWGVIITGTFLLHPFFSSVIFASRDNPILPKLPKGSTLDRHGEPIAAGDPRIFPLASAGEPLVWAFLERRLSEQLTTDNKTSKLLFLPVNDEGFDVKTTIDSQLQRIASDVLKDCSGALIIIKTNGEILAFASSPNFNPNGMTKERFEQIRGDARTLLSNRCESPYSPGSTFKILVAAKLIEKGVADKPFHCNGSVRVGQKVIKCKSAHGLMDLKNATRVSCNCYYISKALSELSGADLASIYNKFSSRPVKTVASDIDKAYFAIGQGSQNLLSPTELAVASATIATGMKPSAVFQKKDIAITKVIDPKIAEQVAGFMSSVVKQGTAKGLRCNKANILSAKTGTAEVETSEGITNNALLTGFAGRKKPEIAFALVLEHVQGTSATEAVPRMKKVLDFYFDKVKL